jgi:hypothetical protein
MKKKSSAVRKQTRNNFFSKGIFQLIGALIFVLFILIGSYFFRINNIICEVDNSHDPGFCQNLSFLKNQSLFFTNFEKTPLFTTTLINDRGQVLEPINIKKRLPGTLIIFFQIEDPYYKLKLNEQIFIVNSGGYLALDDQFFSLPLVSLSEDYLYLIENDRLDFELHNLIYEFILAFTNQGLDYDQFYLNKDESEIILDGIQYVFEEETDPDVLGVKIGLINDNLEIARQASESQELVQTIDMRFDLPVVKF